MLGALCSLNKDFIFSVKLSKCFVIDDSYVAITDQAGDIKLVFNLNQNMNDVDEDIIEECKTHILNYDKIQKIANNKTL